MGVAPRADHSPRTRGRVHRGLGMRQFASILGPVFLALVSQSRPPGTRPRPVIAYRPGWA